MLLSMLKVRFQFSCMLLLFGDRFSNGGSQLVMLLISVSDSMLLIRVMMDRNRVLSMLGMCVLYGCGGEFGMLVNGWYY